MIRDAGRSEADVTQPAYLCSTLIILSRRGVSARLCRHVCIRVCARTCVSLCVCVCLSVCLSLCAKTAEGCLREGEVQMGDFN